MPILLEEDRNRPLPTMHRVRQTLHSAPLADIEGQVRRELQKPDIAPRLGVGQRVAVAVGSRGIKNLSRIVKAVLDVLLEQGAHPFVLSAMGSHGGGTEEGQREVLAGYGITPEAMGVEVVTTVDTLPLGQTPNGVTVHFDRTALAADLILPINRIKLHTDFVGPLQSGLCKMLVIGLGNHQGCSTIHEEEPERFATIIEQAAALILEKTPVGLGIAILEDGHDETSLIEAVPAERLIAREKELVKQAKAMMPTLLIPEADILVVEEIGKNISGAGFDPNILGRSSVLKEFVLPILRVQRMVLLDVTEVSHGNGIGVGLFDIVTRRVVERLDLGSMYANAIACKCIEDVKIPLTVDTEEEAVRVAIKACRGIDRDRLRIVKIKNTLELEHIEVSEVLLDFVRNHDRLSLE